MGGPFAEIITLLLAYKYLVLFPLVFIEGPVVTITAGFASSLGIMNLAVALAVVIVADLVADSLYYAIGRFGREKFVGKWGHFIGIDAKKAIYLEDNFSHHIGKSLWIGKTTLVRGIAFLVTAGLVRYPFKKFFTINLIATSIKSLIFILIGFYFGQTFNLFKRDLNYLMIGTTFIAIALISMFLIRKKIAQPPARKG